MHTLDDSELLRRFARDQAQEAFAELVRRHLDLAYAAALRRLDGRSDLAADVAQQTFIALARHARELRDHPALAGWLYTTARNLAADALRSDRARHRREIAHAMHLSVTAPEPDPAWGEIRPHLDELIEQLDDAGRDAVVRRFFSRQKFGEIAAALHISEDAARMRVERGLERLRASLQRRGVTSTTTALATLLTALPAGAAAPAGLAATVSTAVAALAPAVAPTATLATLSFMSTPKAVGIACGVVALVTGGVYLARQAAPTELQAGPTSQKVATQAASDSAGARKRGTTAATSTAARSGPGAATAASGAASPALSPADELKKETAAALLEPSTSDRALKIAAILKKLSRENWPGIRQAFADEKRLHGRSHIAEWDLMTHRAGEVMGREAVEFLLAEDLRAQNNLGATRNALTGWAAKDPGAALEWLSREAGEDTRRKVMGAAIRGLILSEPDLAIAAFESIAPERRVAYTRDFASGLVRSVGLERAEALITGMVARSGGSDPAGNPGTNAIMKDFALIKLQTAAGKGAIEEAIAWLTPQLAQAHVDQALIVSAVEKYAWASPEKAAAWLHTYNDGRSARQQPFLGYPVLLSTWIERSGAPAVGEWLQTQTGHRYYDRLALNYATLLAPQNSAEATRWAGTIKDPALKADALARVKR